jgi:cysteine desulfurase/selenocysteine lyase
MSELELLIHKVRQQFPVLDRKINGQPLTYLDNAATTHKPMAVINCIERYYAEINSNVHRSSHTLSTEATLHFEKARDTVAHHLNAASSKEIIWTSGTTESINLIANSWGASLNAGEEIVLSTLEHHANIVPWQLLAQRTGAIIKVIPLLSNGDLDIDAYQALLTNKTRLVAIGHVSNAIGTINPVKEMIKQAHHIGALVLVDGAQALPHFRVDVKDLDADFYVFSGHKLYAPTGIGVLYGKQALLEAMPPWQAGGEMISYVSFESTRFNELPFKFEAGTPNICGAIALAEAINWLESQNRALLEQHEKLLLNYAIERCTPIRGWQRIGNPKHTVSLLSFNLKGVHQQDIGHFLDQQGIAVRSGHHCAMPLMQALNLPGTTRASFAFYNTLDEVERFATALTALSPTPINSTNQTAVTQPLGQTPEDPAKKLLPELLALNGWNERYRHIMRYGKNFDGLADHLKSDLTLIKGCESNTWLSFEMAENGIFNFSADSEARIIRGLLALIIDIFDNKSASEIKEIDIDQIFTQLSLQRHLSPSRGNGIRAVVDKIYQIAEDGAYHAQ